MADNVMSLRLQDVHIKGYKAIDDLEVSFPAPEMRGDPDIFVIGSKNGVGKTSFMEAISSLYLNSLIVAAQLDSTVNLPSPEEIAMPAREGIDVLRVDGSFQVAGKVGSLRYERNKGSIKRTHDNHISSELQGLAKAFHHGLMPRLLGSLYGRNNEPLDLPHFMYFHSYRKVQEGNIGMGMLVEEPPSMKKIMTPISLFKMEILRALMSQGGLFETKEASSSRETLQVLNDLVREFAGGTIDKLRAASDNTVEFRVTPVNGGETFNFDGLSSGQKEIISTLFLIWHHTKGKPGIVLIDEPELHLNSEWHRKFVQYLNKLAPQNQYILATHSEDIFAFVDPERRILLEPDGGETA